MDKIWYRNPSKSEVNLAGMKKNEWRRTNKSQTRKYFWSNETTL